MSPGIDASIGRKNWWAGFASSKHMVLVFRLLLAGIFLLGSISELVDIQRYSVQAVYNFGLLPKGLAVLFGVALPFMALLCGLGLLLGILTRLSALGSSLMSIVFFLAKTIVLLQGKNIDCGCDVGAYPEPLLGLRGHVYTFNLKRKVKADLVKKS